MKVAILRLYCGESGKMGFYNSQELGLAKAYQKKGYEPTIFILNKKIKMTKEIIDTSGIKIINVPCISIANHGIFNLRLLKRHKIDILHLQSDNQIFAPNVVKYCKKAGVMVYDYIGTVESDSSNRLKKCIMRLLFLRNKRVLKKSIIFAKTPYVKEKLLSLGLSNVTLAPVGLDKNKSNYVGPSREKVRGKLGIKDNEKLLIFVGRMEKYKAPNLAIELINDLDSRYHLLLIGKGSLLDIIKDRIAENTLENRVTIIEEVSNTEIQYYYKASDVFINFNRNEIFGMSILEAMYNECPVIAFKAPGPNFIIKQGVSGFLVNDIEEMKSSLSLIKREMRNSAKNSVESTFMWDKTCEIILSKLISIGEVK